jgi:hypothetical protein
MARATSEARRDSRLLPFLAVALGIGATATIFGGLYNAVVWKPLPVADPLRVFRLQRWSARRHKIPICLARIWLFARARRLRSYPSTDVVALESHDGAAYGDPLPGQTVSANFFADLGVRPLLGRTFQADQEAVTVLGYGFWRQKLHGDAKR